MLVSGVRIPVLSGATNRFLSENRKPIDRISLYQQPRLTNKYYYGISSKILLAMTAEDHERCYEYLLDYKEENPNISNIELDKVATEFYIQIYENKGSVTRL